MGKDTARGYRAARPPAAPRPQHNDLRNRLRFLIRMNKTQGPLTRAQLDTLIDSFLDQTVGEQPHRARRHVRRLVRMAVRAGVDETPTLNLKIMDRALHELRKGFAAFEPYKERKIAVFGSARSAEDSRSYQMAVETGKKLVDAGFMVVTGAGPGIMEAANRGAGRENSFGVNIVLPFEADANPYIAGDPKLVDFNYFFTRKVVFVKETDGIILFPGGFGTQDEFFESLTLIQTGKSTPSPIVMVEPPGSTYWQQWHEYVRKSLLGRRLISPGDMNLYKLCTSVEEAVEEVTTFYRNYYSIRYIGTDLVIRVRHPITDDLLADVNTEFGDLIVDGRIERAEEDPAERIEELPEGLHRLRFHFRNRAFGRLRVLIDRLNEAVPADLQDTAWRLPAVREIVPSPVDDDDEDDGDDG